MTLPAFAAERRRLQEILTDSGYAAQAPAATERYLLPQGTQQQTSHTLLLLVNQCDRQTDGQMGEPRRLYNLCWREHSRCKLSPTLVTAYYSCPDNASSPM